VSVPYAGHNTFFKDADGNWWSTMFGNDAQAPIDKKPGLLRVEFDKDGHLRPFIPAGTKPYVPPGIDAESVSGATPAKSAPPAATADSTGAPAPTKN
jgi:hypothetical protein